MLFNNYMFNKSVVLKAGSIFVGATVVFAVASSIINYLSGENEAEVRPSRITMEEIKTNEYYEDANTNAEEIVVAREVDADAGADADAADADTELASGTIG
jgi:mannitol-specific phosphotransferase system IIBC component